MFSAKKTGQDKNKNRVKFLDSKKDTHSRLKALRQLLDIFNDTEVKQFFCTNYTQIFYVFSEEFTNLEFSAKSKGAKLKDELEELLVILEKIFLFLPEKIHERWHYNAISLILCKLLHHGNVLCVREQGIKLFMLWLQILQENIDEFNLAIFASIVPGFKSPIEKIDVKSTYRREELIHYVIYCVSGQGSSQSSYNTSLENEHEWCVSEVCNPICSPQQGEKPPLTEELTKRFLEKILDFMTKKMLEIQWTNKHMRERGFFYVFEHFRRFYLPVIFAGWNPEDHLYKQDSDEILRIPVTRNASDQQQQHQTILQCQHLVVSWLIAYTIRLKSKSSEGKNAELLGRESVSSTVSLVKDEAISPTSPTGSESSVDSSTRHFDLLLYTAEIVRTVLYTTQENVLTIYEILRQCFLLPLTTNIELMKQVLSVFREWLFKKDDREKPMFVLEPKRTLSSLNAENLDEMQLIRTPSYKEAVKGSDNFFFPNVTIENSRAGFQANVRFFIAISAQIFYVVESKETVTRHSDICRKVMKMYRSLVLEMTLDSKTWRQLLSELLLIAEHILKTRPPNPRYSTLGGQLASYLLQTLFVTWIRASLQVHLAEELWDHLLHVCSTYTAWEELIQEWAGTMETLTRVMARTVYRIDLHDPPLHKSTRKDRVKKLFQRKISSGEKLKKQSSMFQGQSNNPLEVHRMDSVGEPSTSNVQPPSNQRLPRSSSEPGIGAYPLNKKTSPEHHATTILSDSYISAYGLDSHTLPQDFKISMASDHKKTLAEIADYPASSFDENVFTSSITSQMFRDCIIPEKLDNRKEIGSDNDSEITTGNTGAIGYLPLKDSSVSGSSSKSEILKEYNDPSMNNLFSSSSNENLLSDKDSVDETNSKHSIGGKGTEEKDAKLIYPVTLKESVESLISSNCETTSVTDDVKMHPSTGMSVSLHASVSSESETDLMQFEQKRAVDDGQSIDSHMFSSIFDTDIKSPSTVASSEILERIEGAEDTGTTGLKVHFNVNEDGLDDLDEDENDDDDDDNKGITMQVSKNRKPSLIKPKSVIEGGTEGGWTPLTSVILWQRMLGIMGNVNEIKEPVIHESVFKHLIEIWLMLEAIQKNQGVTTDNKSTPPPPALTPPLFFCGPWCFQAASQDFAVKHKPGRVLAFKLMCMMTTRNHGLSLSDEHITYFYRYLHEGLTGADQEVINAIISQCWSFYTLELPSSSCLYLDFISGASTIISTQYMTYPRKEAVTLIGSLLCFPGTFPAMKIHSLNSLGFPEVAMECKALREKILLPLMKAVRNDPSCRARCIALNCLGLFIIETLEHLGGHQRIYECLALILSSLEFHNQTVSTVALDVLWTLTFYHDKLEAFDQDLPVKIVEAMCMITQQLHTSMPNAATDTPEDQIPEYLTKLLLVLLDWVMVIPQHVLLKDRTEQDAKLTYLGLVMKIFKKCTSDPKKGGPLERRRSLNVNQMLTGETRPIKLQCVHNDLGMDDVHGITDEEDSSFVKSEGIEHKHHVLKLTSHFCISQVLNFYQHFPIHGGAVCPGSLVYETDDQHCEGESDTKVQNLLLNSNNMQFLLIDGEKLLTVIELPQHDNLLSSTTMTGEKTMCRIILRDFTGKYSWEISDLFELKEVEETDGIEHIKPALDRKHSRNLSVSSARLTWSTTAVLPTWETVNSDCDRVDQLLRYIGQSSPECLIYPDQQLNVPAPVPDMFGSNMQSSAVTSVLKQHNEEENYVHEINNDTRISAPEISPPTCSEPSSPFHVSKMLLHQLGYFSSEKRKYYELLERNEKLLREIKNLDKRSSRETQKVAVFYVAPGQEDKHSILSNNQGSQCFEEFVSGLGWEVDLSTHAGFMGGLEKNLSTGVSAPYFATHSLEIIFHVSTRMPGTEEESLKTKLRHLGNDEIHIVWSEHSRDFRRGIINTEFGDVMIMIYPLKNDLYRIQIDRNPKIQPFGPLFDGAIVDKQLLAPLVRCTAINAGRAKRAIIPMFKRHYEERARCIQEISSQRVHSSTFEDFCGNIFAPNLKVDSTAQEIDVTDSMQRTFSVPSRSNSFKDPTGVLKLLDNPDASFRYRTTSAMPTKNVNNEVRVYRSHSNTSLHTDNNRQVEFRSSASDLDPKEYKERRKSLTKRFRKKTSSVDVGALFGEKLGE